MKLRIFMALLCFWASISLAHAQTVPAQGPLPVSGTTLYKINMEDLQAMIQEQIQDSILPALNNLIDSLDPPVRTRVVLDKINCLKPVFRQTAHTDQPNTKYVVAPFEAYFEIKLNNAPNKRMVQRIELQCVIEDWFLAQGDQLTISAVAMKPRILDAGLAEKIINFLTLGRYTAMINEAINKSLPGRITTRIMPERLDARFNRMSIDPNGATRYDDDEFLFQFKAPDRRPITPANTITVTPVSVKRLQAIDGNSGTPLYDTLENIHLELYVNREFQAFNFSNFRETQTRAISSSPISVTNPGTSGNLILIWNVKQRSGKTDSQYKLYSHSNQFGNGPRTMTVKKTYILKPFRLPNGQMTRPREVTVNAYEISFTIKVGLSDSLGQ